MTPVTVINVAGGSVSATSTSSAAAAAEGDVGAPLLTTMGGDGISGSSSTASTAAKSAGRWNWCQRRSRFALRLPTTWSASLTSASGVNWIVRGLCICVGMMLMGAVGSFTLHQMMSPQIESLLQQRSQLQQRVDEMHSQVVNMTQIADSRLQTIHLLEKALERQALSAAQAAAVFTGTDGNGTMLRNDRGESGGSFVLPTVVYAWTMSMFVMATVAYRVYNIARSELPPPSKRSSSPAAGSSVSSSASLSSSLPSRSSLHDMGLEGVESMPVDAASTAHTAPAATGVSSRTTLSPRCYKRGPGNSPTDGLMHV